MNEPYDHIVEKSADFITDSRLKIPLYREILRDWKSLSPEDKDQLFGDMLLELRDNLKGSDRKGILQEIIGAIHITKSTAHLSQASLLAPSPQHATAVAKNGICQTMRAVPRYLIPLVVVVSSIMALYFSESWLIRLCIIVGGVVCGLVWYFNPATTHRRSGLLLMFSPILTRGAFGGLSVFVAGEKFFEIKPFVDSSHSVLLDITVVIAGLMVYFWGGPRSS